MELSREKISLIIGQRIHDFRVMRKMSQEALAFESDLHPAYLGKVERGEKCPTVETLCKIASGLKIPLHELMDISAEICPTNTEAVHRIKLALDKVSAEDATEIAEIVERIVKLKGSAK